jgi:hypothetical protein
MPLSIFILIVVGLGIIGAFGLVLLVRYFGQRRGSIPGSGDIEGVYVTTLGTLYAVFIAFMIFVVWTRSFNALTAMENEATQLGNVYRLSATLPQPLRNQLQQSCIDYANTMIKYEWPDMQYGRTARRGHAVVLRMWGYINSVTPQNELDDARREVLLTSFVDLVSLRRYRLLEAQTGLPGLLYGVLIFGGVLVIGLAAIFSTDTLLPHALKTIALAAIISLMLLTIWSLDYPFQGPIRVDPSAFQRTLDILRQPI